LEVQNADIQQIGRIFLLYKVFGRQGRFFKAKWPILFEVAIEGNGNLF